MHLKCSLPTQMLKLGRSSSNDLQLLVLLCRMGQVYLVLVQWQVAWGRLLACSLAVLLAWAMYLAAAARKWTLSKFQVFALSGHVAWSQQGNGHVQVS